MCTPYFFRVLNKQTLAVNEDVGLLAVQSLTELQKETQSIRSVRPADLSRSS